MEAIVWTGDELKHLEKRFGSAAEALENPNLLLALPRLRTPDRTQTLVELLERFGSALAARIVAGYHEIAFGQRTMKAGSPPG